MGFSNRLNATLHVPVHKTECVGMVAGVGVPSHADSSTAT